MKNAAITQTITHYLAKNFENLKGAMPDENYFLVRGASTSERTYAEPRIAIGTAVDVLAETIENKQFFGWYIPEEYRSEKFVIYYKPQNLFIIGSVVSASVIFFAIGINLFLKKKVK